MTNEVNPMKKSCSHFKTTTCVLLFLQLNGSSFAQNPPIEKVWQISSGLEYFDSSPAIGAGGVIYVAGPDGLLHALNRKGQDIWVYDLQKSIGGPCVALYNDAVLYVGVTGAFGGGHDGGVIAVNTDGTLKWTFNTPGRVTTSPALAVDGTIYSGCYDGNLYAINEDGTLKWTFPTAGRVERPASIGLDGTIYFPSMDGKVYAANPDGTEKWSYQTGGPISSTIALGEDGTIYIGSNDGLFYALTPTGGLKWTFTVGANASDGGPAIGSDGTIYFGARDNYFHALAPDGTEKWRFETQGPLVSSPSIVADGSLYFGSIDGNLYSLSSTGALNWNLNLGAPIGLSSPMVAKNGTVYIGSRNFSFSAFTAHRPPAKSPWPSERHDSSNTGRAGGK
jgi:outer membrane protein assembly factor BamB